MARTLQSSPSKTRSDRTLIRRSTSQSSHARGILPGFVGQQPRILLLDEPAAGLDATSRTLLVEDLHKLRNRENAILLASHHTDFTACATHLLTENTMETNPSFEESKGVTDDMKSSSHKNNPAFRTGILLNQRTLSTVASNGIAGFLTLGILLALVDASAVDSSLMQASGLFSVPLSRLASLAITWFQCCMNTEHWIGGKPTAKVFQTHTSTAFS